MFRIKAFTFLILASKQTKTLPVESPNHLVGKLDWVYQEELYGRGNFKGFWWQPDGDQIAFLELDETPLTPFVVMDHLPVLGKSEVTNYPKAGDSNPLVRVGVTSGSDPSKVQWVDLSAYKDEQIVVSAVTWSQDGTQLMLQIQNREQTWLDLVATDATRKKRPSTISRQHAGLDRIAGRPSLAKQWRFYLAESPNGI